MAKIIIDGTEHEFSTDFDLGEARVIKRYTNLNLQELDTHDPTDPDLIAAFMHIVFRREQPSLTFAELEAMADAVKLASIDMRAEDEEEAEAVPPAASPGISDNGTSGHSNGSPEASPEIGTLETTGHLP